MVAPPWRFASPSPRSTHHILSTNTYNIMSQGHSHSHSTFHSMTTLAAYTRRIHIATNKTIGFRSPLFFNIEMHKSIPMIAYYERNPLTSSKTLITDTASISSISLRSSVSSRKNPMKVLAMTHIIT